MGSKFLDVQEEDGVILGDFLAAEHIKAEIKAQKILEVGRIFSVSGNRVEIFFNPGLQDSLDKPLVVKKHGTEIPLQITQKLHTKAKAKLSTGDHNVRKGDLVYVRLQ